MASLLISVTTDFADLKCFNNEIDRAPVPVPNSKIFPILIFFLPIYQSGLHYPF